MQIGLDIQERSIIPLPSNQQSSIPSLFLLVFLVTNSRQTRRIPSFQTKGLASKCFVWGHGKNLSSTLFIQNVCMTYL